MLFNVSINNQKAVALIDTGSTVNAISRKFVELHNIPVIRGAKRDCVLADGSSISLSDYCRVRLSAGSYTRFIEFSLLDIEDDVIFGTPWLETLDIQKLDCENHVMIFQVKTVCRKRYRWWGVKHARFGGNSKILRLCRLSAVDFEKDDIEIVTVKKIKEDEKDGLKILVESVDPVIGKSTRMCLVIHHTSESYRFDRKIKRFH